VGDAVSEVNLLFITYKVDETDSLVGFVAGWLRAVAARVAQVEVICLAQGPATLPGNVHVHSLGKERGASKLRQALAFWRAARRARADAVFCQFSPIFVFAIAPFAKLRGWPILLWYTHRHVDLKLRVAMALVDRVLTASPESFRLASPKVRVIGHGLDTDRFSPGKTAGGTPARKMILAVGRIAPIKHYEMLIEAARILIQEQRRDDLEFLIVGDVEGQVPAGYAEGLRRQAAEAGLEGLLRFCGRVPHNEVVDYYRRAAVTVNLCPTGGLDKAVLEGMAAGRPTLVRNCSFAPLLGVEAERLLASDGEVGEVAERLARLLDTPEADRVALGLRLRNRVVAEHSQERLAGRLVAEVQACRR
jgi:glycosyltransferase involved in cell wall biosynthesis